jgi:RNA polymerase sigma factor (sigma-70 family)
MLTIKDIKNDNSLTDEFFQENTGLIWSVIRQLNLSVYNEDYFQVGCIGLLKAINRFNVECGNKFSTYAIPMISGELRRYIRDFESMNITGAKISRGIKDIYFKSKRLSGSGINDTEICSQLGITPDKLNYARQAMNYCISLDSELPESNRGDKGSPLYDIIPDDKSFEDELTEEMFNKEFLGQLYECLSKKQSEVLYFHLNGLSQNAIAKKIGTSQVQISRIIKRIIEKGKQIAEGEIGMKNTMITEEQLLAECREHGTSKDALKLIADKYNMRYSSLEVKFYRLRIKDKLISEKDKNISPEIIENIETELPKKFSCLKVIAWSGKECTYAFEGDKLVISKDGTTFNITDYKTMCREMQELIDIKEAG